MAITRNETNIIAHIAIKQGRNGNMKRYYSTQRPLGPGTFPKKDGRETPVNFLSEQGKVYCEEIDRFAWGYIEYPEPLSTQEAYEYELVEGGTSGNVVEGFYNDGTAVAFIVE